MAATAEGSASFAHAMALQPVSGPQPADGRAYAGNLNPHWTIGPKIHGGVMMALCAKAAQQTVSEDGVPARIGHALGVSANFLGAPDPGPVRLATAVRKRGRRINVVDVELIQAGRTAVRATVTVGEPEDAAAAPLLVADPVAALMTPAPPEGIEAIGPGHPMSEINHLAAGCDIRPDVASLWAHEPGRAPRIRTWVRPRDEPTDALFALLAGDISMPVTYAVGRTGWAPTVQMTAYLRAAPADGWLRVLCSTHEIGQTWFDSDHTVLDSTGRLVVQTRQLAMVPVP